MLVLTRREGETFTLGDDIEIEILDIKAGVVRVGIRAPRSVRVLRSELIDAVAVANREAAGAACATTPDPGAIAVAAAPVKRST